MNILQSHREIANNFAEGMFGNFLH